MDHSEMANNKLSQLVENEMNQAPIFKAEPDTPENQIANSRKTVLRGVFNPMAIYILGKSLIKKGEVLTPENILRTIINEPVFKANQKLVGVLINRFGLNPKSPKEMRWLEEEALKISLKGNSQPLNILAQEVTKSLSEDLRKILTQIIF